MGVCHVFLDCKNGTKLRKALHILWRLMLNIYKHACSTTPCMLNKDSNIKCFWTSFFPRWKLHYLYSMVFTGYHALYWKEVSSTLLLTLSSCISLVASLRVYFVVILKLYYWHLVKSVRFRGLYGPYFPAFRLNADQINSKYEHFSRRVNKS